MSDRFLYVYIMKERPDEVRRVVPRHVGYWHGLELPDYLGGPFGDHSGGAISFKAENRIGAERLVAGDPFVVAEVLKESWLKEWRPEQGTAGM